MCYYEMHVFACRDWKWGNFRQHCQREYRTGETCGSKLVYQNIPNAEKCKTCQKIDTKERRRQQEQQKIIRWQSEGSKYRASMEKAWQEMKNLESEINSLYAEKAKRYTNLGSGRPVA